METKNKENEEEPLKTAPTGNQLKERKKRAKTKQNKRG